MLGHGLGLGVALLEVVQFEGRGHEPAQRGAGDPGRRELVCGDGHWVHRLHRVRGDVHVVGPPQVRPKPRPHPEGRLAARHA